MKHVLTATLGLLAISAVPAAAADLPVKARPMVPVVAAYNWTGCYIGGNVGGKWARTSGSVNVAPANGDRDRVRFCLDRRLQPRPSLAVRLAATTSRRAATGSSVSRAMSIGIAGHGPTRLSAPCRSRSSPATSTISAADGRLRCAAASATPGIAGCSTPRAARPPRTWKSEPTSSPSASSPPRSFPTARRFGDRPSVSAFEYAFWSNLSFGLEGRYSWYGSKTYNAGLVATVFTPNIGAAGGTFTFAPATQTVKLETFEIMAKLNFKIF